MKNQVRLHKYIANCGYTSRRRAELLIQAGRVKVNGEVVTSLGSTIDPAKDRVLVNGDPIQPPERLTVMFHKPSEVITSTHDTHDRLTVMDLLPKRFRELGVFPVGRLDQDTEGLLILTNDGDLHHRIAHPRHEIDKEYAAEVEGLPPEETLLKFAEGIVIEGRKTAPARVLAVVRKERTAAVTVVITEGRKRQVRRMFEAVGHPVIHLRRVRVGNLGLGKLPRGEWRKLHPAEIEALLAPRADAAKKAAPRSDPKCSLSQRIVGSGRAILATGKARERSRFGTENRRASATPPGDESAGITLQRFKK
ncbi:MAG: rRNA pseudouridine synthase, partial [Planctomycetes bacterium]|nr:rRNA pseudouridine synthase [Planctomycetota bacterium]